MLACFRAVEGIVPMHAGHDHSSDTGAAGSLPNDPLFVKQWYLHNIGQTGGPSGIDIKAVAAWQKVFSSKAITVAVVDSGVDVAHPDLKDHIWINSKEIAGNGIDDEGNGYIDDINGWNFFQGNNLPADLDGHGTHVAGTIGASSNNNVGITGIAWGSPLMAVKVLPSEEERIDTPGEANAIAYGIRYAADNGAKIINLSLGSDNDDLELREAVIYAASKGALLITAAGNDNKSDEKSIGWPSNYNKIVPNNLINIGSTNELGLKSGFSNFGDSVDLLAPGGKGDPDERPNGSAADIISTEKGSYQYSFGTSMATPVVSGSAALVWALNPAWNAETVIKILINSARVTPDLSAYAKEGRQLDLDAAITYARNLLGNQIDDIKNLIYFNLETNNILTNWNVYRVDNSVKLSDIVDQWFGAVTSTVLQTQDPTAPKLLDITTSSWTEKVRINRVVKASDTGGKIEAKQIDFTAGEVAGSVISGGKGNDDIKGFAGWDLLDGGAGDDPIHGGNGRDILTGGTGRDELHGDFGWNTYRSEKDGVSDLIAIKSDQFLVNWLYGKAGNSPNGEKSDIIEGLDSIDKIKIIGVDTSEITFAVNASAKGVTGIGIYGKGILEALYTGGDLTLAQIQSMTSGDASAAAMSNSVNAYGTW